MILDINDHDLAKIITILGKNGETDCICNLIITSLSRST